MHSPIIYRFRAALLGLLLAESQYPDNRRLPLGIAILQQMETGVAIPLASASDPIAQLLLLTPLFLKYHDQPWQRAAHLRRRPNPAMAALVAACITHGLTHQPIQTLLPMLHSQFADYSRDAALAGSQGQALLAALQTARQQPTTVLSLNHLQPPLQGLALALHSWLTAPNAYGLVVTQAYRQSRSTAVAMLTGLIAGAWGSLDSLPMDWLINSPTLPLERIGKQADRLFACWAGITADQQRLDWPPILSHSGLQRGA
jgi:hypothetical protein